MLWLCNVNATSVLPFFPHRSLHSMCKLPPILLWQHKPVVSTKASLCHQETTGYAHIVIDQPHCWHMLSKARLSTWIQEQTWCQQCHQRHFTWFFYWFSIRWFFHDLYTWTISGIARPHSWNSTYCLHNTNLVSAHNVTSHSLIQGKSVTIWIVDTGATDHITSVFNFFTTYRAIKPV